MTDFFRSSKLMDEDSYWQIIEESLRNSKHQQEQEQFLTEYLQNLDLVEIIGFRLRTDKLLYDTYNSEMWCAGFIMNWGCSDDGFEYFRNWVISQGKAIYYNALQNPDSLVDAIDGTPQFTVVF